MAFPDLVDAFDLTIGQLQWVVICFVAASGGLLVPFGALGDRLGHATTVLVGGAVSSVAMVANALAPSYGVL
ncbi:MAG: MFS transporter, partial [Acidimicrobiia bacterium]|nr:MFS transporter [Acidimicrobiia bacterium]